MKKILITILLFLCLHEAYSQTEHQYDSLKNLIRSAKDDSTRFWSTVSLLWDYIYSTPDSANVYLQQNILLAQKMESDDALRMSYNQYASLEEINGNYTGALQYSLRSLSIAEHMNNYVSICESHFALAEIYNDAGNFEEAINNVRKAILLLESKLNPDFIQEKNEYAASRYVAGLMIAASIFEVFNQLDSALQYGKKAEDLVLKRFPGDPFFPLALAPVMGNIYSKKGDYSTAFSYYRSGIELAHGSKDSMDNYNGIAGIFKKQVQLDSSIFYANKVLELSKAAHFPIGKLQALTLLSDVYKLKHNSDSVARYLELANETKDSMFNTKKIMEIQSISTNELLRQQEIKNQEQQYRNRLRTYLLGGGLLVVLLVAGILYRNNRHKQLAKIKIEKAYEELKSTQAQLIQSEKMASLGELTAGIAHEIQNPLNFMNNFSEVNKELLEEMKDELDKGNAKEAKVIAENVITNEEKINHHGKRADAIVKGMLQHSQSSKGQKEPTDINALCDEYLRLSYHGLRAKDKSFNADFKTDFDNSIGKINIVPQDIGRVLLNLINNAFYAVNERQKIMKESYQPTVFLSSKKTGDKVILTVKDNGNGIPQNIIDKIFQPFFTTKPTGQGTGLGLSLSYDIIKAHGGEIRVETQGGEGSEFVIQLPVNTI